MIYDVTESLLSPRITWDKTVRVIEEHFDPWMRGVSHGIYIQYFENDNSLPVFDKNRDFRNGGDGSLIIHANGASLKPGKFENGFLNRRKQDADHLHRTREDFFGDIYRECLKFSLLLDLSGEPQVTKVGEKLLKHKIDRVLKGCDLLRPDATRRGDWRRLKNDVQPGWLKESMKAVLVEVARELISSDDL